MLDLATKLFLRWLLFIKIIGLSNILTPIGEGTCNSLTIVLKNFARSAGKADDILTTLFPIIRIRTSLDIVYHEIDIIIALESISVYLGRYSGIDTGMKSFSGSGGAGLGLVGIGKPIRFCLPNSDRLGYVG